MDVGEEDVNVRPRFKYGNSFVGIGRFERSKPGRFDHFDCVQADKRHILKGAEAAPPLLAVYPISVAPALQYRSVDDQVETPAVGIFAGLALALYVKWFQPFQPLFLQENRPPNPRSNATVSVPIRENTDELRSTVLRRKLLISLWSSNDYEQRRTIYWRKG